MAAASPERPSEEGRPRVRQQHLNSVDVALVFGTWIASTISWFAGGFACAAENTTTIERICFSRAAGHAFDRALTVACILTPVAVVCAWLVGRRRIRVVGFAASLVIIVAATIWGQATGTRPYP